ncbi:Mn-containing catalase [Candidatus Nitrososphaera evergladensis SR1]|uniref:Mn-containing catalase n=1 Tax=Candidatus Nitrososphaera evergladensis SR1 TaxID=1459636 RepID=A0A075MLI4_9ARCH|nr:manganese catalase family protein [Candidatus Nitrososphaera evergladensis]AIF82321.1 Mn-containing catalase [Candidatus Nitrososphaera evergladensis SR1]
MWLSVEKLVNEIKQDKPDPAAAKALQEGLGGQFGEMRTLMQYQFQNFNFRGDAKPFRDVVRAVGTEEIGHVELISTTINMLLDGSSTSSSTKAVDPDSLPLADALDGNGNIHHFLVAAQSSRPVDAAGNPWSALYVYDSGNLVLNLFYNLMLEATGRLQKCRLYEMSKNKTFRSTVSYLIVRDLAHEKVFAKALEVLGVNWGKVLPVPKVDTDKMPEVKALEKKNLHNQQWTFSKESQLGQIFKGESPFGDGEIETMDGLPDGFDVPVLPDREEEFAPGLDKDLKSKAQEIAGITRQQRAAQ